MQAIFAEDDVPESQRDLIEANSVWYKDKDAARAIVEAHIPEKAHLMAVLPEKRRDAHAPTS